MIPKKPQPMAKADYEATAERFLTGSNAGDKTKKRRPIGIIIYLCRSSYMQKPKALQLLSTYRCKNI